MMSLTPTMLKLYRFIVKYTGANGCSPSYDEMAAALGYKSKSQITRLMAALVERGCISRMIGRRRAIEIVDRSRPGVDAALAALLSRKQVIWLRREAAMQRPRVDPATLLRGMVDRVMSETEYAS